MERFWCLCCHWRPDRHSHEPHPDVVYLHFFFNYGFPDHNLHGTCFLDEHQKIYFERQAKSPEISIDSRLFIRYGKRCPYLANMENMICNPTISLP